jgi:hypothetical protein
MIPSRGNNLTQQVREQQALIEGLTHEIYFRNTIIQTLISNSNTGPQIPPPVMEELMLLRAFFKSVQPNLCKDCTNKVNHVMKEFSVD